MAVDAILRIEGPAIKGESKVDKHDEDIDIYSWSFGMTQSGTFHTGGGGGAGKVNVQDLSITKYVDASTCDLMLHCCNGAHIDKATLFIRKSGGKDNLEYIKIEMEKLMVTSVQPAGSPGDELIMESVTFNFAKFKVIYQSQDDKGGKKKEYDMKWDMEKNKSA